LKGLAVPFRSVPRSVLVFAAFHLLFGIVGLISLFLSYCVDPPIPPGMYRFDGCSLIYNPWQDGTWQYPLVIYIAAIASSILVAMAHSIGRWILLLAVAAWFGYFLYFSTALTKLSLEGDVTEGAQPGWGVAWTAFSGQASPLYWLVPLGWLAFGTWFLYWRSRRFFQNPRNDNVL
jgi:hypothetical protein